MSENNHRRRRLWIGQSPDSSCAVLVTDPGTVQRAIIELPPSAASCLAAILRSPERAADLVAELEQFVAALPRKAVREPENVDMLVLTADREKPPRLDS